LFPRILKKLFYFLIKGQKVYIGTGNIFLLKIIVTQGCRGAGTRGNGVPTPFSRFALQRGVRTGRPSRASKTGCIQRVQLKKF